MAQRSVGYTSVVLEPLLGLVGSQLAMALLLFGTTFLDRIDQLERPDRLGRLRRRSARR